MQVSTGFPALLLSQHKPAFPQAQNDSFDVAASNLKQVFHHFILSPIYEKKKTTPIGLRTAQAWQRAHERPHHWDGVWGPGVLHLGSEVKARTMELKCLAVNVITCVWCKCSSESGEAQHGPHAPAGWKLLVGACGLRGDVCVLRTLPGGGPHPGRPEFEAREAHAAVSRVLLGASLGGTCELLSVSGLPGLDLRSLNKRAQVVAKHGRE